MISWKVFNENINKKEIIEYNVFNHFGFLRGLSEVFKDISKLKKDPSKTQKEIDQEFDERVRRECMYYFWSKCEWEIILTGWPPHISKEELDRLNAESKESLEKWGYSLYTTPNLEIERKIDVYDQLKLNWEVFLQYVKDHEKEIKKKYKNLKDTYNSQEN